MRKRLAGRRDRGPGRVVGSGVVAVLLALTMGGCIAEEPLGPPPTTASQETGTSSEPAPAATPVVQAPGAPPDAPRNFGTDAPVTVSIPPVPPPTNQPPEGVRVIAVEIVTSDIHGIPTVGRRIGILITGVDIEGKPALVDDKPFVMDLQRRSADTFYIEVNPGVHIALIQAAMYGSFGERLHLIVSLPGQIQGLLVGGTIDPPDNLEMGIVVVTLPLTMG